MMEVADYKKATTLSEALDLLDTGSWRVLAGGTDILPQMRAGIRNNERLLDIQALHDELGQIRLEEDYLFVGALCRHNEIVQSKLVNQWVAPLALACSKIGSAQIRKRGTLGGNAVNASPAADSVPVLVAVGAEAIIASADAKRILPIEELAVRPGRTCLSSRELLVGFRIPVMGKPWRGIYEKVGVRHALQISIADFACLYHEKAGYRISCGSVGPTIKRAVLLEKLFAEKGHLKEDFDEALRSDISPIDDIRASGEYRRDVLCNLIYNLYVEGGVRV